MGGELHGLSVMSGAGNYTDAGGLKNFLRSNQRARALLQLPAGVLQTLQFQHSKPPGRRLCTRAHSEPWPLYAASEA